MLAGAGQHVDNHTRSTTSRPRPRSDEAFRGIIGDRGRGVFNGKVVVRPKRAADRRSPDQRQPAALGAHAEIDTKPELEIYADDVKCSHGTTVGELDAEHLFYLRARGVDEGRRAPDADHGVRGERARTRAAHEPWRARLLDLVTPGLRTLAESLT